MKRAVILGCGSSAGVPGIGNVWGNCNPNEPKNVRGRTSLALLSDNKAIVIDTGADFKAQYNAMTLKYPHMTLTAVFYTHQHADHIMGVDDLRWLAQGDARIIPIYSSRPMIEELQNRFRYLFEPPRPDMYPQIVEPTIWEESDFYQMHRVSDFEFMLLPLDHESVISCGFRIGDFAYTTDVARMEDRNLQALKGVKNWVVDCGAYKNPQNIAHACLQDIYKWNETVQAGQVYFTAMPPSMDYQTVLKETPDGYAPAYDGLEIEINN